MSTGYCNWSWIWSVQVFTICPMPIDHTRLRQINPVACRTVPLDIPWGKRLVWRPLSIWSILHNESDHQVIHKGEAFLLSALTNQARKESFEKNNTRDRRTYCTKWKKGSRYTAFVFRGAVTRDELGTDKQWPLWQQNNSVEWEGYLLHHCSPMGVTL